MAKKPEEKKESATKTLTIRRTDQELIMKTAGVRGQTLEEFFASEDVHTFWHHLMIEAVRKETEKK